MNGKFVIVDVNNQLFLQCWTEGNVVFLSKNIINAQLYKDDQSAREDTEHYTEDIDRFLSDETQDSVDNVKLVACRIEAKFKFIPV